MSQMQGANPDELDDLARTFSAQAQQLRGLGNQVRHQLHGVHWDGRDAGEFRLDWDHRHGPLLERIAAHFVELESQLRGQAQQQRTASADTGSSTAGGVGVDGKAAALAGIGVLGPVAGLAGRGSDRTLRDTLSSWSHSGSAGASGSLGPLDFRGRVSGSTMTGSVTKEWGIAGPAFDPLTGIWAPAQAGASLGAQYALAQGLADGSVTVGPGSLDGRVSAFAGARAGVDANVTLGPDGLGANIGAGALLGATASGAASASAYGQSGTVSGHVTAGFELKADADAKISYEHVKASVELGAALGIGIGGKISVDLSPAGAANEILKRAPQLW